jgi:plastocyanin
MKVSIAVLVALALIAGGLFATVGSASTKVTVVTVTMTDFHFKFSPAVKLKHGVKYTFKVVNKGAALHNFDIQAVKASKIIPRGKTTSITVTFKKAGKYPYLCDVPRHAELGMAGTLRVS